MKNTFGNSLTLTLFGESHGDFIGAVIDGISPGVKISHDAIKAALEKRRPKGKASTSRVEADEYKIISGELAGYTTGAPLTILIPNENKKSDDYSEIKNTPRPSHADYAAEMKYLGYQDRRGGGHFSGRITAALVAAGGILMPMLESKGIHIGTHIVRLGDATERGFEDVSKDIAALKEVDFPALSPEAKENMLRCAETARDMGDSLGGVLETAIVGLPAGLGEPWFDTLEGMLSHGVFSVPAVKGVEFGLGFGFGTARGSEANDAFAIDGGKVITKTNNNGGINGGITNGMPVIFRSAVKATPSIFIEQDTVDLTKMENCKIKIEGRHDATIVPRVAPVIDAVAALVIADLLIGRFGTNYFSE